MGVFGTSVVLNFYRELLPNLTVDYQFLPYDFLVAFFGSFIYVILLQIYSLGVNKATLIYIKIISNV